ncbi:MAG: FMN-binding glutamate synthase family protein [Candidatus Methanosuratincola sp.]
MQEALSFFLDHPVLSSILLFLALVFLIAVYDVFIQKRHAIQHNHPVVGHLRYLLEMIGPELRQYWVASDKEEKPFNRSERTWIYTSAKGVSNVIGYGTSELLYGIGYAIVKHSAFPKPSARNAHFFGDPTVIPCLKVMGEKRGRRRPYRPMSVVNISALSFGSLGARAVSALNIGAREAHCYHNTGEGGVSPYHEHGAELMWQLGTGYFGARTLDGKFSLEILAERVRRLPQIRCIEIKLSQGAKAGLGGMLPGRKVTKEIARIRGVPPGVDCVSPSYHSAFATVDGLIDFVELIAEETGLPVGIKSAVGELSFWEELARRMRERSQGPDFISIDGGEGGTGAAPLTFADHVSLPFKVAFSRVYMVFQREGIAGDVFWIGSAKLGFPDRAVKAFAMGCDAIQIAREAMLAIGCVQSMKCHTNRCPTGVATQNWWLERGLNVEDKARRFASYIRRFRKELLDLSHAAGYEHPCQFEARDIELSTGVYRFANLEDVLGYRKDPVPFTAMEDLKPTP